MSEQKKQLIECKKKYLHLLEVVNTYLNSDGSRNRRFDAFALGAARGELEKILIDELVAKLEVGDE